MSALYVHLPFCLSKCPYCDFYSRVAESGEIERYVSALCVDIHNSAVTTELNSVYFGGGTPSLLTVGQVEQILNALQCCNGIAGDVEITVEVNPGTVSLDQLRGYRQAGVNRLSIGVQSFDDKQLRRLGRRHDSAQALQVFDQARQAGFERISLDVMFALPGQTLDDLHQQLQRIQQLTPEHVSVYGLTVEEDTPFAHQHAAGLWQLPDDEHYRQMFLLLDEQLTGQGFEHYEISNYARPNERCRHNMTYWQRQPYLGVGAGAHSFIAAERWGERWSCPDSVEDYIQAIEAGRCPRHKLENFSREQAMAESVYLALRCHDGVNLHRFMTQFGQTFAAAYPQAISRCEPYLLIENGCARFDAQGWLVYNSLVENFL